MNRDKAMIRKLKKELMNKDQEIRAKDERIESLERSLRVANTGRDRWRNSFEQVTNAIRDVKIAKERGLYGLLLWFDSEKARNMTRAHLHRNFFTEQYGGLPVTITSSICFEGVLRDRYEKKNPVLSREDTELIRDMINAGADPRWVRLHYGITEASLTKVLNDCYYRTPATADLDTNSP